MNYFVTGATGFIGRFVVQRLLKRRGAKVYVLVRPGSKSKFEAIRRAYGASEDRLIPVWGDVTDPGLTDDKTAASLKGEIDHVFHLAAVYDMNMDDETGNRINNEGTRNVVQFCNALADDKGHTPILHHASSIAVAGDDFEGNFTEDMFDEGQSTSHPYYRTKFESERIVREESTVPWRVYRPGMVVGASETGEMDKIDGPYYLFPIIKRIRDSVPKWLPLLGVEGGLMPLAPVDFVADAMVAIAHKKGLDGKAFHLVQTSHDTVGRVTEIFFDAAYGPGFARKFELPELPDIVPRNVAKGLANSPATMPIDSAMRQMSRAIGLPVSALGYLTNKAMFDDSNTRAALKDTDIKCPELKDYARKLWEYWETYMDFPEPNRRAQKSLRNKIVLITGASSGIGLTSAKYLAANGARVVMVARGEEMLKLVATSIRANGGEAHYYPCDLTNLEAIDELVEKVVNDMGHVDVLINNAGRSIRRAVMESLERFHDYERTMQLNYFSCVRLITKLLPSMVQRKSGHIVNISSIGCLANSPRFAAYVASKSALDAFSRCLSAEVKHNNVSVTTIYMPLVRTPMIAPTKIYDYAPVLSVDDAALMVLKAVVEKPKRMKTPLGQMAELNYALWPKINDYLLSKSYQLFPTSAAAKGQKTPEKTQRPSAQGIALAQILRGAHL